MGDLGAIVRSRRAELDLRRQEVVDRSDGLLSLGNLTVIETKGRKRPTDDTLLGLCRGLDWPDSAVEDLREGRRPGENHEPVGALIHTRAGTTVIVRTASGLQLNERQAAMIADCVSKIVD